ncbi:glycosyltransferase 87 family protein [Nonomuraea rhizosphaerae]|uniref:glycosyltransferase 87 family protein n=1 Tax=Nonomuraea rhizosphaerae TaxID=2665663 RepID=UPI001C5ECD32|nr:glycosyltransferase 87 family protein [Nonomuraea rhizosphaerae]
MSRHTISLAFLAATLAALVAVLVRMALGRPDLLRWYLVAWALFALALWLLRSVPEGRRGALVVAGGIVVAATGLAAPPSTSTDSYRYAWDGRVQAAGLSPYDHPPADPALSFLRDGWLFPGDCDAPDRARLAEGGCTRINRPAVHTIYPPLAEGYFLAVHLLSPGGVRHKALQLGGALMAIGVLLALCRRFGADKAAYWAWCPAVPAEAVGNAHVDMLGVLLVVLAFCVVRGRGALLGAAVAAKLLPVVTLPGALSGVLKGVSKSGPNGGLRDWLRDGVAWRRIAATLGPAVLVVLLAYLPYLLVSRASVAGYLFGYVQEEGYEAPSARGRYAVLRLVMPDSWAPFAAILVLGAVVFYVLRHGDAERPWGGALLVSGTLLLVLTPEYSWYALLVVALVALDGRWEWLGVALAGAVGYLFGPATLAYTLAALAVTVGWAVRRARRPVEVAA